MLLDIWTSGEGFGGGTGGGETTGDFFAYSLRDYRVATGEDVDGGVSMLGPGVHSDVAFCNDHHARKPVRVELVEDWFDDGRAGLVGGFDEGVLQRFLFEKERLRAIGEL